MVIFSSGTLVSLLPLKRYSSHLLPTPAQSITVLLNQTILPAAADQPLALEATVSMKREGSKCIKSS